MSDRLVEIGLLPENSGDIPLTSLHPNLASVLRKFGKGALLIVSESQIPQLTQKFLRIETRLMDKIEVAYVLARNNQ